MIKVTKVLKVVMVMVKAVVVRVVGGSLVKSFCWSLKLFIVNFVRYWASLVRLDRQAEGTLPPHSFAILLVYFLQQQVTAGHRTQAEGI